MNALFCLIRRPAVFLAVVVVCTLALRYAMDMVDKRTK